MVSDESLPSAMRVRVKPIYPRYREGGPLFRIGAQRGLTLEFSDQTGEAWDLCELLDGTRDIAEVVREMRSRHPNITEPDVSAAIARFDSAGLLDDPTPSRFDGDTDYRRYLGNVNYFSHFARAGERRGAHQERLCASTVALLGLGGGGSTILTQLCALGIGTVRAIDRDKVEVTNLNRQLMFEERDIGLLKTDAAARWSRSRNSLQQFEFFNISIEQPGDIHEIVDGCDLVITAVDEPPGIIQRMVNKVCVDAGITCLYGATQVSRGRIFSVIPGETGCIDCLFHHYNEIDDRWASRFRTIDWRRPPDRTLAFAPNVMRLAAEIADEAARLLTGYLPPRSPGAQLEVDFETGTTTAFLHWPRSDDCPTCGSGDEEKFAEMLGSPPLRTTSSSR